MQTLVPPASTSGDLMLISATYSKRRRIMPVYKGLRVKIGYTKAPHAEFWQFLLSLYKNLLNNVHFPKPPVDLAIFKTKIDEYQAAISATMGGAKLAFAERDSLRYELMDMFKLLAAYVENKSHDDLSIF